eukprot:COSAG01_NODE_42112_length_443_cov_1.651163_1_plen_136_part_10
MLTSDASVEMTLFKLWLHGGDVRPGVPPYKPPPGPPGGNHSHPHNRTSVMTGARVWVDGKLLIDLWDPDAPSSLGADTARVSMVAGEPRRVVVEYWIADGLGSQPAVQLQWDQTSATGESKRLVVESPWSQCISTC